MHIILKAKLVENCFLLGYYATHSSNFLPIVCPETSPRNYHYSLRKNPEERSSLLLRGGSRKSRITKLVVHPFWIMYRDSTDSRSATFNDLQVRCFEQ